VEGFRYDWHLTVQRIIGEGQHAASWIEFTGPEGTQPGLCFFDLADDGKIALITDFWPDPYELPASRAHLVERYRVSKPALSHQSVRVSTQSAALPGRHPWPCRRRLSHRPVAGAEQANIRKVYGRILRRVAAEFGEDIAPDVALAWG
jgi:hypothetical protein